MESLRKRPLYSFVLPILDGVTIVASLIIAILLRGRSFAGELTLFGAPLYGEVVFLIFYGGASVVIFNYLSLYNINVFTTVMEHTIRIVKALFYTIIGIAILSFFTKASFIVDSRLAILYYGMVAFLLMLGGRVVIFRNLFLFVSRHKLMQRNVLLVGAGSNGINLAANLLLHDDLGLKVIGFLDDELPLGRAVLNGIKVIGRTSEVKDIVRVFDIHEIIIGMENIEQARLISVLEECVSTNATVKVASPLYDVVPARLDMEKYGDIAVVGISRVGPGPIFEAYKRVFDTLVTAMGLVFLAPVFAMIAMAIKLDSRGPVLFRQVRIGRNGRPFDFYKFRSMRVGSDNDPLREMSYANLIKGTWRAESSKNPTKIVDESRVTKVGRILRRTSLDELPQLFNVLKGDMSLVGPRPCLPYEWKHYEEWHKRRLSVTPGCTGMWQVVGRSQVGFQDMVILDLFYSQNISFHLDLWLLLKTIPVMVLGKGGK
jgi:exopolysaccharide biosynthesis polyprenyl glycosylphosphotransferase